MSNTSPTAQGTENTTQTSAEEQDRIVWVDCEMTGLDPDYHTLIEIAAIVTDANLQPLDEGIDIIIHATEEELSRMDDFVENMHSSSGLIEEVKSSTTSLAEAEKQVLDYIKSHIFQARRAPLAGNSIATDRGFLNRYMPKVDNFLHYRMIDVSSMKELARRWYPKVYQGQPEKGLSHRALADIQESICELEFYRRALLPETEPAAQHIDTARQHAETLAENFQS